MKTTVKLNWHDFSPMHIKHICSVHRPISLQVLWDLLLIWVFFRISALSVIWIKYIVTHKGWDFRDAVLQNLSRPFFSQSYFPQSFFVLDVSFYWSNFNHKIAVCWSSLKSQSLWVTLYDQATFIQAVKLLEGEEGENKGAQHQYGT